jgi:N-acetylmuramoyl-L-alanine amidase
MSVPAAASPSDYTLHSLGTRERIPIYVDGQRVLEGSAYLIDGITYIPLRAFCDSLGRGFDISWNGISHTASAVSGELSLKAQQDAYYITANERCFYTVGRVLNIEGRIYIPIRPMAKAFCLELEWDSASRSVDLTTTGGRLQSAAEVYPAEDIYWLSRIINAEAGSEPFLGKIAVGNVVLNRVRSRQYPNTVKGVVFDRKYGVQFSPVSNGTIYNSPNYDSIIAARICLEGYSLSDSILFFLNPRIATNFWIVANCEYEFTIGNHQFYS